MKDDLDLSFSPGDRFTGVRMQQGEVQLDSDWNESAGLAAQRIAREVSAKFSQIEDLAARADSLVRSPALGNLFSDPAERIYQFEPETGALRFGDGAVGAVPGSGAAIQTGARLGAGRSGNLAAAQPFPAELAIPGDNADMGTQLIEAWAAIAEKITAYQEAIARESYLPSAGRGAGGSDESGDRDPVGRLAALLRESRSLAESYAQRLERARTDSPPTGDDD